MWHIFEDSPVAREYGQGLTDKYQHKEEALAAIRQYIADQHSGEAGKIELVVDGFNVWLDDGTKYHIYWNI